MMVRQKAGGGVSSTYPYAVGSRWHVVGEVFPHLPSTTYHMPRRCHGV